VGESKVTIESMTQKAIQESKKFSKELDYSEKSLQDVEEILDSINKDIKGNIMKNIFRKLKNQVPTDSEIWSMATVWGAYVGEVMCRNNQDRCKWMYEHIPGSGSVLFIQVDNNNQANPMEKVYKRLKNGPEDNVVSFYNVFKSLVLTGKLGNKE